MIGSCNSKKCFRRKISCLSDHNISAKLAEEPWNIFLLDFLKMQNFEEKKVPNLSIYFTPRVHTGFLKQKIRHFYLAVWLAITNIYISEVLYYIDMII